MDYPKEFSVFEYSYRDASNYKAYDLLLLENGFTAADVAAIRASLESGQFFVPDHIGIPPLQSALYVYSDGPTEDDHPWHEFLGLRAATAEEVLEKRPFSSVGEVVCRFASVKDWESWRYDPMRR